MRGQYLFIIGLISATRLASAAHTVDSQFDLNLFPATYEFSKARFIADCRSEKNWTAECQSFLVPSRNFEDLTIDSALFSHKGNHKLLILTSGVHGAEGFTGAAIQELIRERHLSTLIERGVDVLMIHAVNPYGFKHNRRVTENNVNLNRNFTNDNSIFSIKNSAYERLKSILEPSGRVTDPDSESTMHSFDLLGDWVAEGFDSQDIIVAVGQGQYTSSLGLEYGGTHIEPNVAIIKNVIGRTASAYSDVMALDLHTGLGDQRTLQLMPGNFPNSDSVNNAKALFSFDAKTDAIVFVTGADSGFYETHGDIDDLTPVLPGVPQGSHMIALTLEYGTVGNGIVPKLETVNRLILENQGFHFGYASERVRQHVDASFSELFNPTDANWRAQALTKAEKILEAIETKY